MSAELNKVPPLILNPDILTAKAKRVLCLLEG